MYQYFIPFYYQTTFHCGYTTFCLSIHQSMDILGFCFLSIMSNAALNIPVHVFVWT